MNPRFLLRLGALLLIPLLGALLLARSGAPRPERALRLAALGVAAPATSTLNEAQTGQVPAPTPANGPNPVTVDLRAVELATGGADLALESHLDSPLSLAQQEALQRAALSLPADPAVQDAANLSPGSLAPILGTHFDAIDYAETGTNAPPDPEIAVGNNHIIAVVNVAFQIYHKNGAAASAVIPASNFLLHPSCTKQTLYDPNVLYDEKANRYLIGYDVNPASQLGGYCLAVSQSGNPLGSWWVYFFGLNDSNGWLDFPQAAIAHDYVVVAGNVFNYVPSPNTGYVEAKIWAFNKTQLYAGALPDLRSKGMGNGYFTLQPLHLHGAAQGTWPLHGARVYFLADHFDGANYSLFYWTPDPRGVPPTLVKTINLGQAGFPINTPQNSPAPLRSNDYRLLDFEFRRSHGWLTQTVSCNPGGGTANCVRWAQIRLVDGALGPAGSGTYGSSGQFRIYPDLAVNLCHDMVAGYTRSSSNSFPGIWFTGRKAHDSPGTLQAEAQLKAGEIAYTSFASDPPPHRWGDYTGLTIDPDGKRFWYIGEYSKIMPMTASRWATYIGAFSYPDCQQLIVVRRIYLPVIRRP